MTTPPLGRDFRSPSGTAMYNHPTTCSACPRQRSTALSQSPATTDRGLESLCTIRLIGLALLRPVGSSVGFSSFGRREPLRLNRVRDDVIQLRQVGTAFERQRRFIICNRSSPLSFIRWWNSSDRPWIFTSSTPLPGNQETSREQQTNKS
ncbi:unnamed protein product [Polarella glacialis]|uniref:Uncharacterized protein n=1 Tax=Polarella glacialis TaxID=89957 RepID=A0A813H5N7_POLGL|nr:unnamed protein product [Polarella glacialis]